jgi:hypothetical protein
MEVFLICCFKNLMVIAIMTGSQGEKNVGVLHVLNLHNTFLLFFRSTILATSSCWKRTPTMLNTTRNYR